jgi:hypothetical protein
VSPNVFPVSTRTGGGCRLDSAGFDELATARPAQTAPTHAAPVTKASTRRPLSQVGHRNARRHPARSTTSCSGLGTTTRAGSHSTAALCRFRSARPRFRVDLAPLGLASGVRSRANTGGSQRLTRGVTRHRRATTNQGDSWCSRTFLDLHCQPPGWELQALRWKARPSSSLANRVVAPDTVKA